MPHGRPIGTVLGSLESPVGPRGAADSGVVTPITFAHRGARADLPENTLPAFARALERGARGLETDAHLSADGEAVLVHDAAFRRGLRRIRVAASTAADLAQLDVPSLADLYRELGAAYELSIDLKTEGVESPILAAAAEVDARERLWLCSPSVSRLRALREQSTDGEARPLDAPGVDQRPGRAVRGEPRRRGPRRREPAPRGVDRRARRALPSLRRAARSRGTCRRCATSAPRSRWASTPSTPTTSTAWSRPSRSSVTE